MKRIITSSAHDLGHPTEIQGVTRGTYTLAPQTPGDDQQALPLNTAAQWLVPTRSDALTVTAASNQSVRVATKWGAGLTGGGP